MKQLTGLVRKPNWPIVNQIPEFRDFMLKRRPIFLGFLYSCNCSILFATMNPEYVGVKAVTAAKELTRYFHVMGIRALGLLSNDPVDSLTELQKKVLQALPERFQTWKAVHIAISNGMPERTFKNLLNRGDLFKKEKMGNYSRLY